MSDPGGATPIVPARQTMRGFVRLFLKSAAAVTAAAALEGLSFSTYVNNVLAAYVMKTQREVAE